MNWLEDRKKSLEWSIKFTRKALIAQLSVQAFNLAGVVWNGYWLYKDSNFGSAFGLGAFISNSLWTLCFCAKYVGEIKDEKRELSFLNELELKEKLNEDREYYKKAKKDYDDALHSLFEQNGSVRIATSGGGGGGGSGKSDVGDSKCKESSPAGYVCKQSDVQNCH